MFTVVELCENLLFAYMKTKVQISCVVTRQLISPFVCVHIKYNPSTSSIGNFKPLAIFCIGLCPTLPETSKTGFLMTHLIYCTYYLSNVYTPQPLYNTVRYNTVLDITRISVGPQFVILDLFSFIIIHFTLVITRFA